MTANPVFQTVSFVQTVTAAVVAAGGSGYAVGNTITLANGVVLTVATLSTTAVATVTITNPGSIAAGLSAPANPQAQLSTNGAGTGATFNLTWSYSVGTSPPIALDYVANPFDATVQVFLPSGVTATFGLEYTLDNIMTTPVANVRWVSDPGNLATGSTAGGTVHYSTPVFAVRLNVAALAGGNMELRVLQS